MAKRAVSLGKHSATIDLTRLAAYDILGVRHRLKVPRVNAAPDATEVVKYKSVRYRPDVIFVGPTMGHYNAIAVPFLTVASGDDCAGPEPASARTLFNLLLETI